MINIISKKIVKQKKVSVSNKIVRIYVSAKGPCDATNNIKTTFNSMKYLLWFFNERKEANYENKCSL